MAIGTQSGFRRASPFPFKPKRVPGLGPLPARLMLIGEKPGREEARVGKPFVGRSGQYLSICLEAAAINRNEIYITNLTKEFTEYSKPSAEEIERDHDELVCEIVACNPEVIGLVGAYAVRHVLDRERSDLERTHGIPIHADSLFGGELTREGGYTVVPCLHTAGAVYSPDSMPSILDDYLQIGRLLDGEVGVGRDDPYAGKEQYRVLKGKEVWDILRSL